MKNIYLLFVTMLVFASCSEWKYSRGTKWTQPEFKSQRAEIIPEKQTYTARTETTEEIVAPETDSLELTEKTPLITYNPKQIPELKKTREIEDSVTTVDDPEIVRQALIAEKNGRKSQNTAIAAIVFTIFPFLFLGAIICITISLVKGISSLKAKYNTPEGLKMARTGVIISSVILGLYVLAIIALIVLLIFLLALL